MTEVDQQHAVKQGRWYAGGLTPCPVRIVQMAVLYGSHDQDDPPEMAEDVATDCFYIRYRPPGAHEQWRNGGVALTLREAVFLAERKLGPGVDWDD